MKYILLTLILIICLLLLIYYLLVYKYICFKKDCKIIELFTEGEDNLHKLFELCANKYKDEEIKKMIFTDNDRGLMNDKNVNDKYYRIAYDKTKPELDKYCGPGCTFISWPSASIYSFEEETKNISKAGDKEPTINKVGWYGSLISPMDDVIEHKTRPLLKKIGDENHDLFDIVNIIPQSGKIDNNIKDYLSLEELVSRYKYLIDIGGNGYSGRVKYLLFSKRPLLYVDRKYIEYFNNDLKPYEHYIPVKEDLSDLLEQTRWMIDNYEESLKIAQNAYNYAVNNFTNDKILDRVYYVYKNIKE